MKLYKKVCRRCQQAEQKISSDKMPFAFRHRWSNKHVVCKACGHKVIDIYRSPPEKCEYKMEHAVAYNLDQDFVSRNGIFSRD